MYIINMLLCITQIPYIYTASLKYWELLLSKLPIQRSWAPSAAPRDEWRQARRRDQQEKPQFFNEDFDTLTVKT